MAMASQPFKSQYYEGSAKRCQAIGQESKGRNWCTENYTWVWGRTLPRSGPCTGTDEAVESLTGDIQEPSGHNPVWCALG